MHNGIANVICAGTAKNLCHDQLVHGTDRGIHSVDDQFLTNILKHALGNGLELLAKIKGAMILDAAINQRTNRTRKVLHDRAKECLRCDLFENTSVIPDNRSG